MPDFRVTAELGQPLHAPCICSLTIPVSLRKQPEGITFMWKLSLRQKKMYLNLDGRNWEPTYQILYKQYPHHHPVLLVVCESPVAPLS